MVLGYPRPVSCKQRNAECAPGPPAYASKQPAACVTHRERRTAGLADGVEHLVGGVELLDLLPKRRGQESRALVSRPDNSDPAVGDPEAAFIDRLDLVCRDHAISHPGSLVRAGPKREVTAPPLDLAHMPRSGAAQVDAFAREYLHVTRGNGPGALSAAALAA
jgi:hypothetical protein